MRQAAADAMRKRMDSRELRGTTQAPDPDDMAKMLRSGSAATKTMAIRSLKDLPLSKLKPFASNLRDALGDPDSRVRRTAAELLGRLKDREAVPLLIRRLDDQRGTVRLAAEDALRATTGQSFGPTPKQWLVWWEKQK